MPGYFIPPYLYDEAGDYAYNPDPHYPVEPLAHALFRYYNGRARGLTVLKINGQYATYDNPTTDQVAAATEVYMGGHQYIVSTAVATALQAQGYAAYVDFPDLNINYNYPPNIVHGLPAIDVFTNGEHPNLFGP